MDQQLLENSKKKANDWLNSNIDDATRKEIQQMLANPDPKLLIDSFYRNLEFGTGGLRGVMGAGSNCINIYTIGIATQGLANYLKKSLPGKDIAVVIGHDSRNNSRNFAEITADVFSANGINVYLFPALRPTPLLSFAIRNLKCQSGVVITASHNPKEYNGYKAYWDDGAQLVPPHDKNVIDEVNLITSFDKVKFKGDPSKIKPVPTEVENEYYAEVNKLIPRQDAIKKEKDIPIVYSSLHGAGITMVPECLKRLGFTNVTIIKEQEEPNGDFPTVPSPNPEEQSAMAMALAKAQLLKAELVMATDPDTDRVGFGIKNEKGEFYLLNGNQAFSLMMWFIMKNLKKVEGAYIAKTIVTSELVDTMAEHYDLECHNTLTGFKYIAELMTKLDGQKKFIAAGEESYGYMVGDFVRDKDAVSACAFFAAMAAAARADGFTLHEWLIQMYQEFAFYKEGLVNLVRKGAEGERQIKDMMDKFRKNPPLTIAGEKVIRVLDYKTGVEKHILQGSEKKLSLPKSDVLQFYTWENSKISVRPSGTEPKIKFYISVNTKLNKRENYYAVNKQLDAKIKAIEQELIK
jgi:phosphoglucomutase